MAADRWVCDRADNSRWSNAARRDAPPARWSLISVDGPLVRDDVLRRPERQGHERQRAVRAAAGWRRRRADDEEIFVIVGAAVAVDDARRWIGAHAAAATRVIE